MSGRGWSRNWNKNTALAAEGATLLDLVEVVEINMRGYDEVKITMQAYCRKVWEMATANGLKASKLSGDGGSIISRIIEIESKSKFNF